MTTEQQEPIHQPTVTPDSPGQLLRAAREARGLTQPEVASRLNLRVSLVRDIEEDRFDQRTASTFTRGYLKTYAKLVGASEERVVAAYEQLGLTEVKYAEMHSFSGRNRLEANENRMRIGGWLLCIALMVGILVWIMGRPAEKPAVVKMDEQSLFDSADRANEGSSANDANSASEGSRANDQGNGQTTQVVQPVQSAAVVPAPVVSAASEVAASAAVATPATTQETAGATTAAAASVTVSAAVAAPVATASAATEVIEADKNALVISYSGPCWLEIKDATGKKVVSATRQAGQRDVLTGKAPFRLNIGAPKYVTISFMGEAVDMSRFPIARPARFELPLKN